MLCCGVLGAWARCGSPHPWNIFSCTHLTLVPACALQSFPPISGKPSLMDKYEYVMFGKIYKYKDSQGGGHASVRVEVYVSFGGLLMLLAGDPKKLQELEVDLPVYLLMRRV